jgi:S-(hydroxymethyl)glutathione dehydrogenase/alcohol dehydrogenase
MKAAVLYARQRPLSVEEIDLDPPKAGEVRVRIKACGVCHTDLSVIVGSLPLPLPIVLGHEGAGVIEEVGSEVVNLVPGDHVVLSWRPACGHCPGCKLGRPVLCQTTERVSRIGALLDGTRRLSKDGQPINHMILTASMAEAAIVPAPGAIRIDRDVPFDRAALVGCAVTTGVGAVLNTARVPPGSRVAVFGLGGVGLSVVQGALIAGAEMIVAVDRLEAKLKAATGFGATHTVDAATGDPSPAIRQLTGGGVDYAFEAIGNPEVVTQAFNAARPGGTVVVIGVSPRDASLSIPALPLVLQEKSILGSYYGSSRPEVDMPKLIALYKSGKLKLDEMITRRYPLDEVNQAVEDLRLGVNVRGVITF